MKLFQTAKKNSWTILLFVIPVLFFYQTILFSRLPFPGDLLVGHYEPYRSYSYLGYAPAGVPNKAQGPDVIRQIIPWKSFAIESIKKKEIPLWNPYNFSGNPLMANFQTGVFYPLNLIFFFLPFQLAWSVYILLIPILSIVFTYLYLKNLKLSNEASALGAISFSFSLYMVVWLEWGNIGHTLLFLPLLLLITDKIIGKTNYKLLFFLALTSLFSILAGYIQGFFYIVLVVVFYFLIKAHHHKKLTIKKSILFFFPLLFAVLISLFQIIPTLELFASSSRGNYGLEDISHLLNPAYYLITVIAPDFFGNPAARNYWFLGTYIERVSYFGLIPFVFAIFAALDLFKKIEVKIFSIIFIVSLILATDLLITKYFYLIPIPVISTTVPTRLLSLFAFSGSMLAAFGFDYFIKSKDNKKLLAVCLIINVLLFGALIFTYFYPNFNKEALSNLLVSRKNLILPFVYCLVLTVIVLLYSKQKTLQKLIVYFLIFMVSFELFYYFQKITPFSPREFLYPQTPVIKFLKENAGISRFWGYGSGYIESNFQTFDGTFSPEGADPLHIKGYTELLSSSKNGEIPNILPRPDANISPGFGKEDLKGNAFRQEVLNILGVKYVLHRKDFLGPDLDTFSQDSYKLVWENKPWQVYENLTVVPRIFITNKYRVAENKKEALRILYDDSFNETEEILLFENPRINMSQDLLSSAKLVSYDPNKVVIRTNSNGEGLLFLSDNYYPGWIAKIDDNRTKIYTANYSFRAVKIPTGSHQVIFEYKPKSFYYSLYVSFISLVIFISILFFIKIKKYEI